MLTIKFYVSYICKIILEKMIDTNRYKSEITQNGFTIFEEIYTDNEIKQILIEINRVDKNKETFRKSKELFAIRQFLKEIPEAKDLIFNEKLLQIVYQLFGNDYFVVKSIYFDKPETSNWYVAYHQDLSISVNQKIELKNFGFWTKKQNQFNVQPPIDVLENIFTIRIHLDDTTENNGALKVIPKSHLKKIYRPDTIDWDIESETFCKVNKGGVMVMKPLLLHASNRTTNNKKRRVIHLEFSNYNLPNGLNWAELQKITY